MSAARDQTALIFILLILAEIMLFTFVNTADLIINSSSKDEPNSITTVKAMNQKLKFLGLAIFLAFGAMGIGQYLLYRESTDSIIFHCREINKQHISFHNLISSLAVIPSKVANNKFRSPSYCKKYMKKNMR